MSQSIALQRINDCLKKNQMQLDLSNLGLTTLPKELKKLKNHLDFLNLSDNQISDISIVAELSYLKNLGLDNNQIVDIKPLQKLGRLKYLFLNTNQISDILPLQKLENLEILILESNQITNINALENLKRLKELFLNTNQISDILPLQKLENLELLVLENNQINNIKALENLKQLEELWLNTNQISDISPLKKIEKLEILILASNQISDICPLQNLEKLELLGIENNQISDISPLGNLEKLRKLVIENNQISDINALKKLKRLEILGLNTNQISDILPLQKLEKLERLGLDNNPIKDFYAITGLNNLIELHFDNCTLDKDNALEQVLLANKGLKKISCTGAEISDVPDKYYKSVENPLENLHLYYKQERKRVLEAKLLLLGDAESGKSTLTDKLLDPQNPTYQGGSTHAVRTITWQVPYENPKKLTWEAEEEQEKQFTVQIYDFGGQEILKSVHKHFFSEESVYVLVVDTRKADNHSDDWWYKWFQSVRYYGGKDSPIFILFNQREEKTTRPEVPERVLNHFQIPKTQVLYSNLDKNENLAAISQQIQNELQGLRHVGDRYPKSLLDIRQRINELKATNNKDKAIISLEDFEKECVENKNEDVDKTATFLNNLSDIFYFDRIAKDWVILDRDWLLYAIYELFWEKGIQDGEGKLCKTDLHTMLKNNDRHKYELNKMDYLLKIMEKYGIIYQSNQKQGEDIVYICPQLSATNRPANSIPLWEQNGDKSDIFRFKLHFPEFMPLGILYLFMSRASKYIHEQQQWRTGVVFNWPLASNPGLHLVEMIETRIKDKQEIEIVVKSPKTADVFSAVFNTLIVEGLEELDKQNQLQTEYQVACTCSECEKSKQPHYFSASLLKKAAEKQLNKVMCQKSLDEVPTASLQFKFSLITPRNYYKKVKSELKNPDNLFNKELVMQQLEKAMQNYDEFHQRLKSDYNDAILAFCQALESELTTIFNKLKEHLKSENSTKNYSDKGGLRVYDDLYQFVFGTNFLNLGGMAFILDNLKLLQGNQAVKNLSFLIAARKFLFDHYKSDKLQKFVTELLGFNKKEYRNKTAHLGESYSFFDNRDARGCKDDVFSLLNLLTDARK